MRWILALALASCTVGASGRMELAYDGAPRVAVSVEPAIGVTSFEDPASSVATQDAIVGLLRFGLGWSNDGVFVLAGLEVLTVPAPGHGAGFTGGFRVRVDPRCVRWSVGGGATALLAQLRADDRVDSFGPNPRVTRAYQDATAFVGWRACDDDRLRAMIGVAYEAGVSELLFAPGP